MSRKLIKCSSDGGGFKVCHENGTHLGDLLVGDDGYWGFWPILSRGGYWSQELMGEIVDHMKVMNAPLEGVIAEYFRLAQTASDAIDV